MSRLLQKYQINIWMYGNSQIQGTKSIKDGELRDNSVPYFQQESKPCPLDWRITIHWNFDLVFFQQSWHIRLCWRKKITRKSFQCFIVLQYRGQNFIFVEISWSQDLSGTYVLTFLQRNIGTLEQQNNKIRGKRCESIFPSYTVR